MCAAIANPTKTVAPVREFSVGNLTKINAYYERLFGPEGMVAKCMALIFIDTQRLYLLEKERISWYPISTAAKGVGQREGSEQTPLGKHLVQEKIGEGAHPFAIFKSRVDTGEIAPPLKGGTAMLGRILWLGGVEPGLNQGKDTEGHTVDTKERYIYIHGTNDIANIGAPASKGCIRMTPPDVVDLFSKVPLETPVHIYQD